MNFAPVSSLVRIVLLQALLVGAAARNASALTTNFFEGFEFGLTNWIVGDNSPAGTPAYWGIVNSAFGGEGTHSGNGKAYCAAIGFTGSAANPSYRDYMSAQLIRSIDLTGYTNATLSFWYKLPTVETCCDSATVYIDDTIVWQSQTERTTWTLVTVGLSEYIGTPRTLAFVFDSDLSVTEEGWYLDDITLTDAFTPGPPPANDNFSDAITLVGAVGSRAGSNRNATPEAGEPAPGNSIWFQWTALTNGPVTLRTGGSAFDTVLCVYTGGSLATLTQVACDDNGDTNNASLVMFHAVKDTVYRISVRGTDGAAGFVLLNWDQPGGIGVDRLPDLFIWTNAANSYLYGWYLDREEPTQPGRTLLRVSTATPNVGAGPLELRGSSDTPGVYQRIYRSDGSFRERFAGSFTFHPGHGHLHFDNWINLHLRSVLSGDAVGGIVASGDKTSFAIIDLVRFTNTAPANGTYGGGLVQGLTRGWADVYDATLPDQWIDVTEVPSGRYWLEAIVDPANHILESNESNNWQRILINLALPDTTPPPNDHFTNATDIAGVTAGFVVATTNASRETAVGEPQHFSGNVGAASIWWRWTAPSNMTVSVTTVGSDFDTVLAIYRGASLNTLTSFAANDNGGGGTASRIAFPAVAGETYHIAVDGRNEATGVAQLNFNPAWNDAFDSGVPLHGYSGTTSGSSRGATRQTGEPNHAAVFGTNSIWYRWTAGTNAPFTFDTHGSTFDTLLAVYTGDAVNALLRIASDHNGAASNGISKLTFDAVSNTTYRIAIDNPSTAGSGVARLNWTGPMPPVIVAQPDSSNLIAGASVFFRVLARGDGPISYQWQHAGTNLLTDAHVQGASNNLLRVNKITPADAGVYRCILSNPWGSVLSAPANLIVLDNPRVVYVLDVQAPVGGGATAPIEMQSLGDENTFAFSLSWDTNHLSNPRLTVGASLTNASLTLNNTSLGAGRLGVTLALPAGRAIASGGGRDLARVVFDVNPFSADGAATFVGFSDTPVVKQVRTTNNVPVTTLFAAGSMDLRATGIAGERLPDGRYRLTLSGLAGHSYAIQSSTNLTDWVALTTVQANGQGVFQFTDPEPMTVPQKFFRALLVP